MYEQKAPGPWLAHAPPPARQHFLGAGGALLTCQLDVHVAVQQQILGLKVPVHDVMAVAVLHGRQNLPELLPCFILA